MNPEATQLSVPRVPPGTRLNGIFEIEKLIATGGMGEIYKGRAIQTGDPVAIKVVRPDLAENEAALALFRKEAAALHNLYHEAIVRYYVFTIDPALGLPYLAMEYVEGRSLSELIQKGPLDFESVRILQRRLAAGLHAAHEVGIVHRDVSPDNVILPGGNFARAKIIDFGIAKSNRGDGTVIGSGFAGKFNYVSPEHLGLFGGEVTAKSDIYSLGLVLAEALLGRPLDMGGSHVQVVEKRRQVPDLSRIDARIRPLLHRMLQPNPRDRPESMAEVAAWEPGASTGARALPAAPGRPRRRAFAVLGGVALTGGLVAAGLFVAPRLWPPSQEAGAPVQREPPALDTSSPSSRPADPGTTLPRPPVPDLAPSRPPDRPADLNRPAPPAPAPSPDPAPSPAPPVPANRVAEIIRYVNEYNGGDCFFVRPTSVTEGSAEIEGFGTSPRPFMAFDEAFKRANGFEAQIGLRQVTAAQCPAVELLRAVRDGGPATPRLELNAVNIKSGQTLSGTIEAGGGLTYEILLVADDGKVYNLSSIARRQADLLTFALRLDHTGGRAPKPQLIVAVGSTRPLPQLAGRDVVPADRLFPQLVGEIRAGLPVAVAVKYFKLEG